TQRMRDTLRATLDASSDGLLMIDSQGRPVMANARMEDFGDFARAGLPKTTGEGSPGQLRELSEGLGYAEDELKRLLEEGRRSHVLPARKDMVVTQPRAGQRQRYVERAIRPVYGDEEQFVGLLLVFRDITEQQELEQARKDLTDMVVHELRSPLQAVMGSMRLISQVAPADSAIIHQATEVSQRGQEAAQPDQQPARPLPAGTGRVRT
ncbi:MAG: PAS domain-containing protein, partial [Chloroflexi bacterium]|nr:PAS domain-containing protein [Chloroflexota bacterium]